jgi:hypothetical protein
LCSSKNYGARAFAKSAGTVLILIRLYPPGGEQGGLSRPFTPFGAKGEIIVDAVTKRLPGLGKCHPLEGDDIAQARNAATNTPSSASTVPA